MALTLYRKYRPQKFKEVIGQTSIKITLKSEIQNECLAHAFLFCGPRGVGKTTMARLLAKAVNCLNRGDDGEPCNECNVCKDITSGKSLDIFEMDAASHTKVDEVRENIIQNAKITTSSYQYKVFIIDEVHMLSTSSFNALLKTLEEPPKNVIFILATTEVHKIPVTIISRCQRFDFKKVPTKELLEKMNQIVKDENKKVSDEILIDIIRLTGGYVRDALSLLGQVLSLPQENILEEDAYLILPQSNFHTIMLLLEMLSEKNVTSSVTKINDLVFAGVDMGIFIDEMIDILRKILLIQIGVDVSEDYSDVHQEPLKGLSDKLGRSDLIQMINLFIKARGQLNVSEIEQLSIELAIIEFCCPAEVSKKMQSDFVETKSASSLPTSELKNQNLPPKTITSIQQDSSVIKSTWDELKEKVEKIVEHETKGDTEKSSSESSEVIQIDISFDDIQNKWEGFCESIRKTNHSLFILLKSAKLIDIENGKILLGVKYDFHKQRICASSYLKSLEESLLQYYGHQLRLDVKVDFDLEIDENGNGNSVSAQNLSSSTNVESLIKVDDLLDDFGGKIVE